MDKVLIEIHIPAVKVSYDVFVPRSLPMYEVKQLIEKAVNSLSRGQYIAEESSVLCFSGSGSIVNINLSVDELGIHNGSKLILI